MKSTIQRGAIIFVIFIMLFSGLNILWLLIPNSKGETPFYSNSSCKLYFSFNDPTYLVSGNNVRDDSGNGKDGVTNECMFTDKTKWGRAVTLDGIDDYINVPAWNGEISSGSFTIEAWIRPDDWPDKNGQVNSAGMIFDDGYIDGDYRHRFGLCTSGVHKGKLFAQFNGIIRTTNPVISWHRWNHVAYVWDTSVNEEMFYINGKCVKTHDGTDARTKLDQNTFKIGKAHSDETYHFIGSIDEFKIHDEALTRSDGMGVTALEVNFEEGNGDYVRDTSGFNDMDYVGTRHGATWSTTGVYESKCLSFDGTNDYVNMGNVGIFTSTFSIECWFYYDPDDWESQQGICGRFRSDGHSYNGYLLQCAWTSGKVRFFMAGSSDRTLESDAIMEEDKWNHIAAVFDGPNSDAFIYVNGKEKSDLSLGITSISNPSADFLIGRTFSDVDDYYLKAKVDNVRLLNYVKTFGCDVLRMPFKESSGIYTNDESPYGHHGVMNGGGYWTSDGKYGRGVYFSGNDYVTISRTVDLEPQKFTLEAWINPDDVDGHDVVISKKSGGSQPYYSYGIKLFPYGSGYIVQGIMGITSTSTPQVATSYDDLPFEVWTHVAVTYDGSYLRLYINGILKVSTSVTGTVRYAGYGVQIGHWEGSGGTYFDGYLDNVMISNYPKTFNEDFDGDGMTDGYEIIRSIYSDQFNSIEYNGRYALIVVPTRTADNEEKQFLWAAFCWYVNLLALGYEDCQIYFLTRTINHGIDELDWDTTPDSGNEFIIPDEVIDGDAYKNDVIDILNGMETGGRKTIQDEYGNTRYRDIPKLTSKDTLFIKMRDHGSLSGSTYRFHTYDTSHNNDYLTSTALRDEIDSDISCKYSIIELHFCRSGAYNNAFSAVSNRYTCTSCGDETNNRAYFKLYGAFKNDANGADTNIPRYSYGLNRITYQWGDLGDADTGGSGWSNDDLVSVFEAQQTAEDNTEGAGYSPDETYGANLPDQLFL